MSAPSNKPVDLDEAEGAPACPTGVAFVYRHLDVSPTEPAPLVGDPICVRARIEQMRAVASSSDGESPIKFAARRVRLSFFGAVRVVASYYEAPGII